MVVWKSGRQAAWLCALDVLLAVVYFNPIPCILLGVDHGAEDTPLQ